MIVDDSSVIRGLLTRWISTDPSLEIVASVANGQIAINSLDRYDPEIIVLDIEMPVMDGLTALPKILKIKPDVQVLMSSTLTSKNAAISLKAMELGAADYVPKPTTNREVISSKSFQAEIIDKIKSLAAAKRRSLGHSIYSETKIIKKTNDQIVRINVKPTVELKTRKQSLVIPKIIAVGSSTGGPQALLKFLGSIKDNLTLPVVITQHMPSTFTKILAAHLTKATQLSCMEGEDGMIIEPGKVYVAPGDKHMIIVKRDGKHRLKLNQDAPENFCRPSVDPMLRSLVTEFGPAILTVILYVVE